MRAAQALAVDASSSHVCTYKWVPTASTTLPLNLPLKTSQAVSPSYTQSKAQMAHPQRILGLLVVVSNTTRIVLRYYAG